MLFERPQTSFPRIRGRATQRVWDGWVKGLPDCWVVVPRDDADLIDWLESELAAVDEAPLRICSAIVDDDLLLLTDSDDDADLDLDCDLEPIATNR
jgi:hypothetical protein